MLRAAITCMCALLLFDAVPAFAQFNYTGQSALTIAASPAYPAPHTTVHLSAQSPLLDLTNSSISWSVNGTPAGSGLSIDVPVGAAGSRTIVSLSVSGATGSDSTSVTLIPESIDLLWEASSYTPPFYAGRALPTSGSKIHLQAIPHFTHADGSVVPASALKYTWKVNGSTLAAQSGVGASYTVIPAAILYGSDTVTVDVATTDGSQRGEASMSVRTESPQLVLYIDNPLFGVMYHRALDLSGNTGDSETSFTAVPYFVSAPSLRSSALAYSWTIDGRAMTTDPNDPNELTARAQAPGSAQIGLSIAKPSDPFVSAEGSWSVSFGGGASGGPEAGSNPSDAFHAGTR